MKIYQRLEQLLKFRIYSNAEIPEYLKKLTNMGKIDEVKKIALFNLILTKLGEIEDKEEESHIPPPREILEEPKYSTTTTNTDIPITLGNASTMIYECPTCKKRFGSNIGKIGHMRSHKK